MRVFYGMLDQAAVNARILWRENHSKDPRSTTSAVVTLKNLIRFLVVPYLKFRRSNENLRKSLRINIELFLDEEKETAEDIEKVKFAEQRRCANCKRKSDKKTRTGCSSCQKPICEEHRYQLCPECVGK